MADIKNAGWRCEVKRTVEDAQIVGEAILWAESKLGQLLKEITKGQPKHHISRRGSVISLPEGISHEQSHEAQQLARKSRGDRTGRDKGNETTGRIIHVGKLITLRVVRLRATNRAKRSG